MYLSFSKLINKNEKLLTTTVRCCYYFNSFFSHYLEFLELTSFFVTTVTVIEKNVGTI